MKIKIGYTCKKCTHQRQEITLDLCKILPEQIITDEQELNAFNANTLKEFILTIITC